MSPPCVGVCLARAARSLPGVPPLPRPPWPSGPRRGAPPELGRGSAAAPPHARPRPPPSASQVGCCWAGTVAVVEGPRFASALSRPSESLCLSSGGWWRGCLGLGLRVRGVGPLRRLVGLSALAPSLSVRQRQGWGRVSPLPGHASLAAVGSEVSGCACPVGLRFSVGLGSCVSGYPWCPSLVCGFAVR